MTTHELKRRIRMAWAHMAAPSGRDVERVIEWTCTKIGKEALFGIAPMDVDIDSPGFYCAEPLFDLPPSAAAAYLGTFLLSLVDSLEDQKGVDHFITRPHTLAFLKDRKSWDKVIRKNLPKNCQEVLADVILFFVAKRDELAQTDEGVEILLELAQSLRQ